MIGTSVIDSLAMCVFHKRFMMNAYVSSGSVLWLFVSENIDSTPSCLSFIQYLLYHPS